MQSLSTIQADIAAGRSTPREAIQQSLDAIDARDGDIQAFERLADRDALLRAAEAASGPLAGIAIGIKDIFDTFDMETAYGTQVYAGHAPKSDAAIVAMARRAGGAVIGKTVTTEYAYFHPGKTRNPHNRAHTPGGSSSGSAAAVAAGMIPAAIGTQTGGSIIRPAAFCGVAGYKPSFRMLPATGMKTFAWTLDTVGLFAATVADVAAFAAALTARTLAVEPVDATSLRIGLYRSAVLGEASDEMRAAVESLATLAGKAGATIVEIDEPETLSRARDAQATIQSYEASLSLAGDVSRFADRMSAKLRELLREGQAITPEAYDAARKVARHARHAVTDLFDRVDVVIEPAAPGAAPHGIETTGSPVFNKLWTLTGNPAINVPGRVDRAGLPLGVQLVARFGRDRLALSAGNWLQGLV
jgi:Asp-tRNA(Asn)/Glu-tRNA(Gln) amidotransferase A subunit family amidase